MDLLNLFVVEGYSIAEKLGVPSIAAPPHVELRRAPSGMWPSFEEDLAELDEALESKLWRRWRCATWIGGCGD